MAQDSASNKETLRIGLDIGGTKLEVIAMEADDTVVANHRVRTPKGDYDGIVKTAAEMVNTVETDLGRSGTVGVATPGAISLVDGMIKNANSTWLNGKPFDRDLEFALGRKIRMVNDADCFALSEAHDGAGAGAGIVFGVIVGTGTGGAIVVNGRLLSGPNRITGEWGHNPLPWAQPDELPGHQCYCGHRGCIETWLAGPSLARDHSPHTHLNMEVDRIALAAENGDLSAEATLRRYESRMARSLASVINILDPDVIVLGGGLSKIKRLYTSVPELWTRHVLSDRVDTKLLPPVHGDASGVRGAARLWN